VKGSLHSPAETRHPNGGLQQRISRIDLLGFAKRFDLLRSDLIAKRFKSSDVLRSDLICEAIQIFGCIAKRFDCDVTILLQGRGRVVLQAPDHRIAASMRFATTPEPPDPSAEKPGPSKAGALGGPGFSAEGTGRSSESRSALFARGTVARAVFPAQWAGLGTTLFASADHSEIS
jgi:hypothetical protein